LIDIEHLELATDRRLTPAAAREVGDGFAHELARALGGPLGGRGRERVSIGRLVLDAPHAQLVSGHGLRQLARSAARELRTRLWGE
jgi:plasmid stabilization system protein ParE